MTEVIQRFKLVIIAAGLVFAAIMAWFIISKLNENKIPSRGVFVLEKTALEHMDKQPKRTYPKGVLVLDNFGI